jgi:hypothetical protein
MADFSVTVDDTAFQAGIAQLPDRLEDALGQVLDRGAAIALAAKAREIQKTYQRPIPTNSQVRRASKQVDAGQKIRVKGGRKAIGSGGNPAWKRSGDWASQQRVQSPSPLVREIAPEGSSEQYEAHLANLPTGALGINRSNPAAENARNVAEAQIKAVIEQELRNAFGN